MGNRTYPLDLHAVGLNVMTAGIASIGAICWGPYLMPQDPAFGKHKHALTTWFVCDQNLGLPPPAPYVYSPPPPPNAAKLPDGSTCCPTKPILPQLPPLPPNAGDLSWPQYMNARCQFQIQVSSWYLFLQVSEHQSDDCRQQAAAAECLAMPLLQICNEYMKIAISTWSCH